MGVRSRREGAGDQAPALLMRHRLVLRALIAWPFRGSRSLPEEPVRRMADENQRRKRTALVLRPSCHPIRLTRPFHSAQAVAQVIQRLQMTSAAPLPAGRFDNITKCSPDRHGPSRQLIEAVIILDKHEHPDVQAGGAAHVHATWVSNGLFAHILSSLGGQPCWWSGFRPQPPAPAWLLADSMPSVAACRPLLLL